MKSQGQCDTTATPRYENTACKCPTYPENLGPCLVFEAGSNGRCVYCDHEFYCHMAILPMVQSYIQELETACETAKALLNTPEVDEFDKGVPLEAAHQVIRWGAEHDAGKNPEDWFWLVGYLAGKALAAQKAGNLEKAKHHCISTAAALRNWHAHIRSGESKMRPGVEPPQESASQGES